MKNINMLCCPMLLKQQHFFHQVHSSALKSWNKGVLKEFQAALNIYCVVQEDKSNDSSWSCSPTHRAFVCSMYEETLGCCYERFNQRLQMILDT